MQLLTKQQAAHILNVSPRTIDSLRKEGLPCHIIGVQVRFVESEILQWAGVGQSDMDENNVTNTNTID